MVSSFSPQANTASARGDVFAWFRARPWVYAYVVLTLYGFIPGIRRVIDWRTSFGSVSVVSIVPLLSLVPAAYVLVVTSRGSRLERESLVAIWAWLGAFVYAYAIGIASGNAPSATYTFATFILPMCFGTYLATLRVPAVVLYERIASYALALSVPISAYAFYQYVSPPPWDVYWVQQTKYVSIGLPFPFEIRPFSTLNAPAPFADFLLGVLVLNFPRLRGAKPLRIAAFSLGIGAFVLTLVRGDWIGLVLAVITFVALRPRKLRNLSILVAVTFAIVIAIGSAGVLFGNTRAGLALERRFDTFGQIETDTSFRDRQKLFGEDLTQAFETPTGQGLGVLGTAAKLGAAGRTADFDNGYIARFVEMGYFGTIVYLLTVFGMLVATARRWYALDRAGLSFESAIAASAVALQVALVFLDISSDHHSALAGAFFWIAFSLVFSRSMRAATDAT